MDRKQISERIRYIISEQLFIPVIQDESVLFRSDLGTDVSTEEDILRDINIMHDISISADEMKGCSTVKDIVDLVNNKLNCSVPSCIEEYTKNKVVQNAANEYLEQNRAQIYEMSFVIEKRLKEAYIAGFKAGNSIDKL